MQIEHFINALLLTMAGSAVVFFNSRKKAKAEAKSNPLINDKGILINGVTWATRNVDKPGTFVEDPEDAGMYYPWNRKVAWPATGDTTDREDDSGPAGTTWKKANDPSPAGWRVPTMDELQTLLDAEKVRNEWATGYGVTGRRFTDKTTGNSIFLPATGRCDYSNSLLSDAGLSGFYWSSTLYASGLAYSLMFSSDNPSSIGSFFTTFGSNIRSVAD